MRDERPARRRRAAPRVKAVPAVRALAQRLDVDLAIVTPTGPNDTITAKDVERVARILKEVGPLEMLRGVRRAMARSMAQAHAEVAPVTVNDDADLHAWWGGDQALMLRLIRAIVGRLQSGAGAERVVRQPRRRPARAREHSPRRRRRHARTGCSCPVLRDVGRRTPEDLRAGLERLRHDVRARTIPPEELRGYTFILSNFGTFGGRYANPDRATADRRDLRRRARSRRGRRRRRQARGPSDPAAVADVRSPRRDGRRGDEVSCRGRSRISRSS